MHSLSTYKLSIFYKCDYNIYKRYDVNIKMELAENEVTTDSHTLNKNGIYAKIQSKHQLYNSNCIYSLLTNLG